MSNQQPIPISKTNCDSDAAQRPAEQFSQLQAGWPHLYDCIDLTRASEDSMIFMDGLSARATDFGSRSRGGRGELYRQAQADPLVRSQGILRLFKITCKDRNLKSLSADHKIVDVLGGDGVLARAISNLVPPMSVPSIVTSDLSEDMVMAARGYGLFAIRQAAQNLLLKDNSMDAVIFAYGTHHIPKDERPQVCAEALRVLKPGGRIVFHDFEVNSPVSEWFSNVVDLYSFTGHPFPHFSKDEIRGLLRDAGFEDVEVQYMYDPFILYDESEQAVKNRLAEYLLDMYGMIKLVEEHGYERATDVVYDLCCKFFRYDYESFGLRESFGAPCVQVREEADRWRIEAPRMALVGSGVKA